MTSHKRITYALKEESSSSEEIRLNDHSPLLTTQRNAHRLCTSGMDRNIIMIGDWLRIWM
jgi:hypothetical protein